MWASENHQECIFHTEPRSSAAAPGSTLMTTHMPVGHSNLLGQHIPHKCTQGQGHKQHSLQKHASDCRSRCYVFSVTIFRTVGKKSPWINEAFEQEMRKLSVRVCYYERNSSSFYFTLKEAAI
ncbi:uncharacterized [Tachysurus ichikawai]